MHSGVLLDHVHGLISDILITGSLRVPDKPTGLTSRLAILRVKHDGAVIVFIVIQRTGVLVPSSLQCCQIWKIKTAARLAKNISYLKVYTNKI